MSKSVDIPVRAYALVADEAAFLMSERSFEIFDNHRRSRARIVAYAAMIALYPDAKQIHLAANLGFVDPASASNALVNARRAQWWRGYDVHHVVSATRRALGLPRRGSIDEAVDLAPFEPARATIDEKAAAGARFVPRKMAQGVAARRATGRVNVTAALFGDPTPAQRLAFAATPGAGYTAAAFSSDEKALRARNKVAALGL